MSDFFKTRMIVERNDLRDKIAKLHAFLNSDEYEKIDDVQKGLLEIQYKSMETYFMVLVQRIKWLNLD